MCLMLDTLFLQFSMLHMMKKRTQKIRRKQRVIEHFVCFLLVFFFKITYIPEKYFAVPPGKFAIEVYFVQYVFEYVHYHVATKALSLFKACTLIS